MLLWRRQGPALGLGLGLGLWLVVKVPALWVVLLLAPTRWTDSCPRFHSSPSGLVMRRMQTGERVVTMQKV